MSDPVRDRKFKKVKVSLPALAHILVHTGAHIESALPSDAVYVRSWIETSKDIFIIVFAHDTFPVVGDMEEIPAISAGTTLTRSNSE